MSAYKWVPYSGNVPPGAVEGGYDSDRSKIYIGRAHYGGEQMPCKIVDSRRQAYVSFGMKEEEVRQCEILVECKLKWQHCNGVNIPANAIPGGKTSTGEVLYIGRANQGGSLCTGKVHPSHKCLYLPYGGKEVAVKSFEILICS